MCEFCTKHGEGQKWYLQMKNYSAALLHEPLSEEQKATLGVPSRQDWITGFNLYFVAPAMGLKTPPPWESSTEENQPVEPHSPEAQLARSKMEHFGQVLPIEDVERVLDQVSSITRMPCGCRYFNTGKTNCRYCFGFGIDPLGMFNSVYPDASVSLETMTKEEAKRAFRAYDREGLMHSIWTGVTPYVIGMCNCDRDCGAYKGYIEMRGSPSFFRAEYICQADWDRCRGCKECMSQCQFGAIFYSSVNEKVYIDPTRCFGCGVCRSACKRDAITLLPREAHPQSAGLWV